MFISKIGKIVRLLLAAAIVVSSSPVQAADHYILGECQISRAESGAEIRPAVDGDSYLAYYHDGDPRYQGFSFDYGVSKISLVKVPAHGRVEHIQSRVSNNYYHYMPNEGYLGKDQFVIQVEKSGIKVRIHYMMETVPEDETTSGLCNPPMWKISATTPELDNVSLQVLQGVESV